MTDLIKWSPISSNNSENILTNVFEQSRDYINKRSKVNKVLTNIRLAWVWRTSGTVPWACNGDRPRYTL